MPYAVKEIVYTLQGEGARAGRAAVLCRFSGCNLWSGVEADRASAVCGFCDTDFVGTDGEGGGTFQTADDLARAVSGAWAGAADSAGQRLVVLTGGEPLMQLDQPAIAALHARGFQLALETNGTLPLPAGLDWVCVSPKAGAHLRVQAGDELKLVFPQDGLQPAAFEQLAFDHFFLQPKDGADRVQNTRLAIAYCLTNPRWRLSIQAHKVVGIS